MKGRILRPCISLAIVGAGLKVSFANADPISGTQRLKVRLSWGHSSNKVQPFQVSFATNEVTMNDLVPIGFESDDSIWADSCDSHAGAGDVDGVDFTLTFPERKIEANKVQQIWAYLLDHSDADTARRLRLDPGARRDTRRLTVQLDTPAKRGFSVTMDQLLMNKTFWVPELDMFLSAGDAPMSFQQHQEELKTWKAQRVIDAVEQEPEATYEQYTSRWEDMGSPTYTNPAAKPPGHIICLSWDSAIPKFGIDRTAGVWSDYGNPDHFQFGFDFGRLSPESVRAWKVQQLSDGLPVIMTSFERDGIRYEVEQFAYPLDGPPSARRGDIVMVLLQKVRLTELEGKSRAVSIGMIQRRELGAGATVIVRTNGTALLWSETKDQTIVLGIEAPGFTLESNVASGTTWQTNRIVLQTSLTPHGTCAFVVKLPSPIVAVADERTFLALDYEKARSATVQFWLDYLARGAQFVVPEEAVNNLFRANLWHALRLPRRHGGPNSQIDLPYSNFAYDQHGTPWPVNQSVYVDYMLYDLRGYPDLSGEELATMYSNNQEPNGHVGGFANWGVYTPGMMYATAQHYLLSDDRAGFEKLLPRTLKALDWCLAQMKQASERGDGASGLVLAPLNDLSHEPRAWAFNQAYLYAGTELLGKALAEIHHPRAQECLVAAQALRAAVQKGFAGATMSSPLVQLRDHTWQPYVPSDSLSSGRLMDVWYPTDVDCGSLHLSRLRALDPKGALTSYLLNDHEDNLFFHEWGMANEPVYNQHATVYLLRDEVKPAIRAFYSMMACAFSHSTFEPVEHRWSWGQYFGPPSTDGAWFELYRHMLIHELEDDSLLLCQATPRRWLENGKQIRIERAPTYYGPLTLAIESHAAASEISAKITLEQRKRPGNILLRLRHPQNKPIQSVSLNGKPWTNFDPAKEWIRIPNPTENHYEAIARY